MFGTVIIHALTGHYVTGRVMTMGDTHEESHDFIARIAQAQNPLLTGGIETNNNPPKHTYARIHFDIKTHISGTMVLSNAR